VQLIALGPLLLPRYPEEQSGFGKSEWIEKSDMGPGLRNSRDSQEYNTTTDSLARLELPSRSCSLNLFVSIDLHLLIVLVDAQ
jgi:hypothetical protein